MAEEVRHRLVQLCQLQVPEIVDELRTPVHFGGVVHPFGVAVDDLEVLDDLLRKQTLVQRLEAFEALRLPHLRAVRRNLRLVPDIWLRVALDVVSPLVCEAYLLQLIRQIGLRVVQQLSSPRRFCLESLSFLLVSGCGFRGEPFRLFRRNAVVLSFFGSLLRFKRDLLLLCLQKLFLQLPPRLLAFLTHLLVMSNIELEI
mmetsp:Transcript_3544/g.8400  ORF Transcript_3544/g.8400 Transcript_3544/m.8400 type:complete len:200 (-) Transcript_3544:632-1231(-)